MVLGPRGGHSFNENWHPANEYAKFMEQREHTVHYCPFVELIELCGEMVGIDVAEIGRGDHYCGTTTGDHMDESGSVFMTCQRVATELQSRLRKLEAKQVTDEELLALRNMKPANRRDVLNRLDYWDEREEILVQLTAAFASHFPSVTPRTEEIMIAWAQEKLAELLEQAVGGFRANCPQAPRRPGPMIMY